MPAIDHCASQIIVALQRTGWHVTHNPFAIKVGRKRAGYIFADLRLEHYETDESAIVVEIKCFDSSRSALEEFYQAVGQYVVYRNALRAHHGGLPIHLALPLRAYESFFKSALVRSVVNDLEMDLIVVDLEREEVSQWITSRV